MLNLGKASPAEAQELNGDISELAARLGAPELSSLAQTGGLELERVRSLPELRVFLRDYAVNTLANCELPAVYRAFQHAARSEARELIALDQRLHTLAATGTLARASMHVGRNQLRKLRPVRDQRFVQRYLAAVDSGVARGWHTLVFGIVLALFSLPLRQGLVHYAQQTLAGFIDSAAGPLRLTQGECSDLLDEVLQPIPEVVAEVLKKESAGPRLLA
jgi:urease accessory protein UreF